MAQEIDPIFLERYGYDPSIREILHHYGYKPPADKDYNHMLKKPPLEDCFGFSPRRNKCTVLNKTYCMYEKCNFYHKRIDDEEY